MIVFILIGEVDDGGWFGPHYEGVFSTYEAAEDFAKSGLMDSHYSGYKILVQDVQTIADVQCTKILRKQAS